MAPYSLGLTSFFLLLAFSSPLALAGKCNKDDKKALVAINNHFSFQYHFASWTNDSACCDWYGIDCDPFTGRVVGLSVFADNLTGTLPPAIGDLPFLTNLMFHKLPNLVGSVPSTITKLTRLSLLTLSWNSLSGPIPPFLSQLTSLTFLTLAFNKFSGSIPPSLANLHNLGALHLDRNQLTGPIPDSFGGFPVGSPPDLYLSHNNLSGPIPASLGGPLWGIIDLSRNKLTGDASVLFGSSKPTTQIDISRNQFGFDLTSVSFPVNLTLLDLNHNMIFGAIPAQINEVTGLGLFNVSYNRLCGQIPAGTVTAQFDEYSYLHNKCLCGAPLLACN